MVFDIFISKHISFLQLFVICLMMVQQATCKNNVSFNWWMGHMGFGEEYIMFNFDVLEIFNSYY